jgi:hypothetical protein
VQSIVELVPGHATRLDGGAHLGVEGVAMLTCQAEKHAESQGLTTSAIAFFPH